MKKIKENFWPKNSLNKAVNDYIQSLSDKTIISFVRYENSGKVDFINRSIPKCMTVIIKYNKKNLGFGEIVIFVDDKGRHFIDTERLSHETVLDIFRTLINNAILDTDTSVKKHQLYNKVMKRSCETHCSVCFPRKKKKFKKFKNKKSKKNLV